MRIDDNICVLTKESHYGHNSSRIRRKEGHQCDIAQSLLIQAKALRINVSQAAEAGIAKAVADKRAELWRKENAKAFDCWNTYVETNGLPLEQYRSF